jgi:Leucine-rich repeat (LRR) protein
MKKKKNQKKVLSTLLAAALVLTMMPPMAFAESEPESTALAKPETAQSTAPAEQDAELEGVLEADMRAEEGEPAAEQVEVAFAPGEQGEPITDGQDEQSRSATNQDAAASDQSDGSPVIIAMNNAVGDAIDGVSLSLLAGSDWQVIGAAPAPVYLGNGLTAWVDESIIYYSDDYNYGNIMVPLKVTGTATGTAIHRLALGAFYYMSEVKVHAGDAVDSTIWYHTGQGSGNNVEYATSVIDGVFTLDLSQLYIADDGYRAAVQLTQGTVTPSEVNGISFDGFAGASGSIFDGTSQDIVAKHAAVSAHLSFSGTPIENGRLGIAVKDGSSTLAASYVDLVAGEAYSGGRYYNFSAPEHDATIDIRLISNPEIVIFSDVDGNDYGSYVYTQGEALGKLPEPTHDDDIIFDGWWTEPENGVRVTEETVVQSGVTYYAHWVPKYRIEGTAPAPVDLGNGVTARIRTESGVEFNEYDPAFTFRIALEGTAEQAGKFSVKLEGRVEEGICRTFSGEVVNANWYIYYIAPTYMDGQTAVLDLSQLVISGGFEPGVVIAWDYSGQQPVNGIAHNLRLSSLLDGFGGFSNDRTAVVPGETYQAGVASSYAGSASAIQSGRYTYQLMDGSTVVATAYASVKTGDSASDIAQVSFGLFTAPSENITYGLSVSFEAIPFAVTNISTSFDIGDGVTLSFSNARFFADDEGNIVVSLNAQLFGTATSDAIHNLSFTYEDEGVVAAFEGGDVVTVQQGSMTGWSFSLLQVALDPSGPHVLDLSRLHVASTLDTDVSRVTTSTGYMVGAENGITIYFYNGFAPSNNIYGELGNYSIRNDTERSNVLIKNGTTLYFAASARGKAEATGVINYNLLVNSTPRGQRLLVNAGEQYEWGEAGFLTGNIWDASIKFSTPLAVIITGDTVISFDGTFTAIGPEDIVIDEEAFPDEGFRDLLPEIVGDAGADGILTPEEIAEITEIDLSGKGIDSLAGIENFTALESLNVSDNNIAALPELPETLTDLDVSDNNLAVLPVLPAILVDLNVSGNDLSSLPVLPAALTDLNVSDNNFAALPELPVTLTRLDCSNNDLSTLPELPPALEYLDCSYNNLSSLPVLSGLSQGWGLSGYRPAALPPLPETLVYLDCSHNQLTSLDLTGFDVLAEFYGDGQSLTLTLDDDGAGTFSTGISFNAPLFGNAAIDYDNASKKLISTSTSATSTTFEVQTGKAGSALSGILTLSYEVLGVVSLDISGITMSGKTYDGIPAAYTGTPVLTDSDTSQPVTGITLEVLYESTDGGGYSSDVAPTGAGAYRLTLAVPGVNASYTGSRSYDFAIAKKSVTVRAEDLSITQGAVLPTPVVVYEGFVEGDNADNTLVTKGVARLNVTDSATVGTSVIDFETQAVLNDTNGSNYTLVHAAGVLTVAAPSGDSDNTDNKGADDSVGGKGTGSKGSSLPQTGDRANLYLSMLSVVLLVTGFGVIGVSMAFGKPSRRRYSRNRG